MHDDVGEVQPSLEKNMSQMSLEMVEGQYAAPEEGSKVEGIYTS